MAVWAEAVPVTRAERAESGFRAWDGIMEAARTFEARLKARLEAEQAAPVRCYCPQCS